MIGHTEVTHNTEEAPNEQICDNLKQKVLTVTDYIPQSKINIQEFRER